MHLMTLASIATATTRRGGKGRGAGTRRKLLSQEIVEKIDYKNPQILRRSSPIAAR